MVDFPFANGYAKRLIELGADINKPDINGHVALHYCITSKNYEMFQLSIVQSQYQYSG